MATTSIGIKVGRAIGTVGAYALEGTVRTAQGAGRFGADVVEGAGQGYTERHAVLLERRAANAAAREAMLAAARSKALVLSANPATSDPATPTVFRGAVELSS